MANTRKAVRVTAKRHAKMSRHRGTELESKLAEKTTEASAKLPKMSWNESIKAAEYIARFAKKNSPEPQPRQFREVQMTKTVNPETGVTRTEIGNRRG